jgi:hypothetical protein
MLTLLGDADKAKLGGGVTLRLMVVEFVSVPDVPVMVSALVPVVAVPLAVNVSVLDEVAGFGLNDAVTPLGSPDADMLTALLKPFSGVTVIVLVTFAPCATLTLLGAAARVKFPTEFTVRETVVEFVRLPEVPVTVTVAVPTAAEALAVSVSVLVELAGFGLNDAVTPLGSPDAEKFTEPLKPFCSVTVIVLVPLPP